MMMWAATTTGSTELVPRRGRPYRERGLCSGRRRRTSGRAGPAPAPPREGVDVEGEGGVTFGASMSPSSSILTAPKPPSSAGWNMSFTVPWSWLRRSVRSRSGEEHRRVAVVAAGVHDAGVGGVGAFADFLDRQPVHVGAEQHRLAGLAAFHQADDAGTTDAGADVDADCEGGRPPAPRSASPCSRVRVRMNISTVGDNLAGHATCSVQQLHRSASIWLSGVMLAGSLRRRAAASISYREAVSEWRRTVSGIRRGSLRPGAGIGIAAAAAKH